MPSLIALLALVSAGCGQNTSRMEFDEGPEKAIGELARSNGSRPLKEWAPGDWTGVLKACGGAITIIK